MLPIRFQGTYFCYAPPGSAAEDKLLDALATCGASERQVSVGNKQVSVISFSEERDGDRCSFGLKLPMASTVFKKGYDDREAREIEREEGLVAAARQLLSL